MEILDLFSQFEYNQIEGLIFTPVMIWLSNWFETRVKYNFNQTKMFIVKSIKEIMGFASIVTLNIFPSLFNTIFTINLMGLTPFVYTDTALVSMTFPMGLVNWLSFIMSGVSMNFENLISHLVPSSTPKPLMSFMAVIETTSLALRPMTLSVRLSANLTAGHLILALMSMSPSILMSMISQFTLMILEILVAAIQAFVFTLLLALYCEESN